MGTSHSHAERIAAPWPMGLATVGLRRARPDGPVWRPIPPVFNRLTIDDLLLTQTAVVLTCGACGGEQTLFRRDLVRLPDHARSLIQIEAAHRCVHCGAAGVTAGLGALRSRRFQRHQPADPSRAARVRAARAVGVGFGGLFVLNLLAVILVVRVAEHLGPAAPWLDAARGMHTALAGAFTTTLSGLAAIAGTSLQPGFGEVLARYHAGEALAFAALLILAYALEPDIVRADRCLRRTFRWLVASLGQPDARRGASAESTAAFALAAGFALASAVVYLIVFDIRVVQAAVVLAIFFFPKEDGRANPQGRSATDGVASVSLFFLNRVGPLVFAESIGLIGALWIIGQMHGV